MVVKVKEPIAPEFALMRKDQLLFTYLHLAAAHELGKELLKRGVNGVAYETIEPTPGDLPLLTPMSAVAGRMSVQAGATYLERERGGKGVLLGGVPGVRAAASRHRRRRRRRQRRQDRGRPRRQRHGARRQPQDARVPRRHLRRPHLDAVLGSAQHRARVLESDLVIGAVLLAGARAPRLVTETMVKQMEPGSVIVDVSIDQGGCVETARPTTHDNPTYVVHDVIHYGVANMPGAVPRTSTYALTNATIQYVIKLADKGLEGAIKDDPAHHQRPQHVPGTVPHPAVAEALGVQHTPFAS